MMLKPALRLRFRLSVYFFLFALPLVTSLACAQERERGEQERNREQGAGPTTRKGWERENDQTQERRNKWFYERRRVPDGSSPAGMRLRALRDFERMAREAEVQRSAANRPPVPGRAAQLGNINGTWQNIGPLPTTPVGDRSGGGPNASGRVTALAIDPRNNNTVYAGGAEGGVWKTTNGGTTWTALTDARESLAIGSIAIAPSNPDVIYVGTGESNFSESYYGAGVLKSTDAGATWTQLSGPFVGPFGATQSVGDGGAEIGGIAVSSTNPNLVLAAVMKTVNSTSFSDSGIYRTTDGGQTWTQTLQGFGGVPFNVIIDPTNPNTAYTALGFTTSSLDAGFYRTLNLSAQPPTWTRVSQFPSFNANNVGRVTLALACASANVCASNQTIYAAVENKNTNALGGLFKSIDGGTTWTSLGIPVPFCNPQCEYDMALAVHPLDANTVYAGGSAADLNGDGSGQGGGTFYRSTNGGSSFSEVSGDSVNWLHSDQHAIAIALDGTRLYAGNDGGIWRTNNPLGNPPTWTSLNQTLSLTQFYPGIAIHPTNVNIAFGGTQDNSTQRYTGAANWEEVNCGDGAMNAIDYNNPNNVFGTCEDGNVYRATQGGGQNDSTWNFIVNGISSSDNLDFIPPMAMDPVTPTRLYFGTVRLYQTNNAGAFLAQNVQWRAISGDLTGSCSNGQFNSASCTADIAAIAVSPLNPQIVYVGTTNPGSRVMVTSNAITAGQNNQMATFTQVTGLAGRFVNNISVNPRNGDALVVYSGFSGFNQGDGHAFRIPVGTTAAVDISGNLPNVPMNDLIADPDVDNVYYVGTDIGVFITQDGGVTWAPLANGLPRVVVMSVRLHQPTRTLRVATHGRGMWDLAVPLAANNPVPALSSLVPSSTTVGGAAFTLTVNGSNFVAGAVVNWNGAARTTSFVNAGQVTAQITAADISAQGTASVTVINPAPGGGTSNALTFTITSAAPTVTTLNPNTAVAGSSGFTLTVNGSGFLNGCTVLWNGAARTTTFGTANQVTATIPANDVAVVGNAQVTVQNPGGGTSTAATFTVTAGAVLPTNPVLAYLPHVPFGGGFRTKITIVNATNAANSGVVNFISQAGAQVASVQWSAAAGGTVRIDTGNLFPNSTFGNLTVTWAVIGAQAAVSANLFYEFNPSSSSPFYNVTNSVGFNDVNPIADFTIPFEAEPQPAGAAAGRLVGAAVANPTNAQVTLTIKLVDQGGNILATDTVNIPALGQTLFTNGGLTNISAALPNGNFIGTLAVHATAGVSVIALEDDYGPFSATPIMPFRVR